MEQRREYQIAFVGLKTGIHFFHFEITDKFFKSFSTQEFTNCNSKIAIKLEKTTSFMMLTFEIGGSLETICDRCGSPLQLDLWDEFIITVKVAEEPVEMNAIENDPEVFYIGKQESHIDVSDWIFEFINLSIPMQKLCGKGTLKNITCDQNVLNLLQDNLDSKKEAKNTVNPIWKGLEQFKIKPKKK